MDRQKWKETIDAVLRLMSNEFSYGNLKVDSFLTANACLCT